MSGLGDKTFPIIQKYVSKIITVKEEEIIYAMWLVWKRMKIIIEPSSSMALATIIKNSNEFKNKRIGIIISGGNIDLRCLHF